MQWVCSITCLLYTSTIRGNADHSGATPMNLRHDALCGSSKIILGIEEVTSMQEEPAVVGTVGIAKVVPGAMKDVYKRQACSVLSWPHRVLEPMH